MHDDCYLRGLMFAPFIVVSTRCILQTLISADNTDVYRPQYSAPCPPFNCAYSNGMSVRLLHDETPTPLAAAKSGHNSQLAVVTEHGAVEICNASKRDAWDLGMSGEPCIPVFLTTSCRTFQSNLHTA